MSRYIEDNPARLRESARRLRAQVASCIDADTRIVSLAARTSIVEVEGLADEADWLDEMANAVDPAGSAA